MAVLKFLQFIPTLVLVGAATAFPTVPVQESPAKAAQEARRVDKGPARSKIGGIAWYASVDDAMKIAQREGKLLFWYHVAGNLDGAC